MHQQSLFHQDITWVNEAHVLAVRWSGFTPHLICANVKDGGILDLTFRANLEIEMSNERSCVGKWDGQQHISCPTNSRVSRFQRCDPCSEETIPDQRCIFEPRCRGDSCLVDDHLGEMIGFCSRPHTVYLAFYYDRIKIGMTSKDRLEQRIIEQGADAYIPLVNTEDRYNARALEKELSRKHSIRQSFSHLEILRMTTTAPDRNVIEKNGQGMLTAMGQTVDADIGELIFLDEFPLILPMRSIPRETTTSGLHIGKKVGIKGRFLYYESNGLRALNLVDIPSRRIRFNAMFGE